MISLKRLVIGIVCTNSLSMDIRTVYVRFSSSFYIDLPTCQASNASSQWQRASFILHGVFYNFLCLALTYCMRPSLVRLMRLMLHGPGEVRVMEIATA